MKKLPPIKASTYIESSVENVFKALTTSDGWNQWFTDKMVLNLVTKEIKFSWKDFGGERVTASDQGEILEYVPSEKFSFTWHKGELSEPTLVTFTLRCEGEGTVVSVCDEGYPDSDEGIEWILDCGPGWGEALTLLKINLENGYRYKNY